MIKIRDDLQKIESTLAIYIRIECIDLNIYLHLSHYDHERSQSSSENDDENKASEAI